MARQFPQTFLQDFFFGEGGEGGVLISRGVLWTSTRTVSNLSSVLVFFCFFLNDIGFLIFTEETRDNLCAKECTNVCYA